MKNAYLICAHAYYDQLYNLVFLLNSDSNDIYIHINLKSEMPDVNKIRKLCTKSSVYFVSRIPMNWGESGLLRAQLILLEEATKRGYDYYHLISGQDLPIKSNDKINAFLEKNKFNNLNGRKYSNYLNVIKQENNRRRTLVAQNNLFVKWWRCKNSFIRKGLKLINYVFVKIQIIFGYDRFKKDNIELCYGQPWWSLTNEAALYVLKKRSWLLERFSKGVFGSDEVAVQTLIYNSHLRDTLYMNHDGAYVNLMKLDFMRGNGKGSPYVWRDEDYSEIVGSNCLFARKFDSTIDDVIIKRISAYIKKEDV